MTYRQISIFISLALLLTNAAWSQNAKTKASNSVAAPAFDLNAYFAPVKWRSIGPFRGGRSVAVSGVPGDITTYYMGTTGGGLWKTTDIGVTWHNISDGYFKTGSVGAVAVAPSAPHIIYVGMGEHAVRGVMTHHGDGVYKSTDAGETWEHMGLGATQHISCVIIHPQQPDIVYVAAQGALYGPSKERGVFKTIDGGKNWQNILYVNEQTGAVELSKDAINPDVLYVAMWEHGRKPWQVISGGAGSGLYKTVNGGKTWDKIHEGLPKELGKMAIAVSRSNPKKVYALIESDSEKEQGGLFVSDNGGKNWSRVSDDHRLIQRAWYYIELFIDPKNENVVYVLSAPALKSIDGGKTWEYIYGAHGDYHDLWINSDNPKNMVMADDGGAAITFNGGKTWSTQSNMPTAQLYRINVDNHFPYRIYAGQQDNTSVRIDSRGNGWDQIGRENWTASAGGESAFLAFDPNDPRYVMGGSYQGTIEWLDTWSGTSTKIMPSPIEYLGMDAKDMKYRFNWNAPIVWSPHEPNTYYHAAQVLLKTTDNGKTWTEISHDLTRNEKAKQGKGGVPYTNEAVGAENYGTIAYVTIHPTEPNTFWTGSDDGLVYLTRDNGKTWKNVTPPGLQECLINAIEVSPHDPATAYIATTRYKFNDHRPGLYKTTNYGATWTAINQGLPAHAFTRVVREDDVRKDLLFAGTELGIFISWNGGLNWQPFQLNLPVTPITDLKIHQNNLIAATSGRSFWILDDLPLIRQYQQKPEKLHVFQPVSPMWGTGYSSMDEDNPSGTHPYHGVNPASGLVIYYHLPSQISDLKLEIFDKNGELVRTFTSIPDSTFIQYDGGPHPDPVVSLNSGINRFVWDLRYPTMPGIPYAYIEANYAGHKAIPGDYSLMITSGANTSTTSFTILPNSLIAYKPENFIEYHAYMRQAETNLSLMHQTVNELHQYRMQLTELQHKVSDLDLSKKMRNMIIRMQEWDEQMIQRKSKAYDDVVNFPNKFTANYLFVMNQMDSDIPVITQAATERINELNAHWEKLRYEADQIRETLKQLNQDLWDKGMGAVR